MEGISVIGSILVDKINEINKYPKAGELVQIKNISKNTGGLVPNVGIDLKRIDPNLKVYALGNVGKDDDGNFALDVLKREGLDVSLMTFSDLATSFTDVMSIKGGERTFFTYPGASSVFGFDDIDFDKLDTKMMHLGYFLLLDKVDNGDGLKILKEAKKRGIKTSIDLVSENSDRYKLVVPCLQYVDNLIINEVEAGALCGVEGTLENIELMSKKLMKLGVKERVIIHMPDYGFCYSKNGLTKVNSFLYPEGYKKGTTGAGDAFCAGALYGIYNNYTDKEILDFASSSAAVSLREPDATSGMTNKEEIEKICSNFKRGE